MRPREGAHSGPRHRPRLLPQPAGVVAFTLEDRPAADASGESARPQKIRVLTVTLASPDAAPMDYFAAKK